jgi:hypothetical protein
MMKIATLGVAAVFAALTFTAATAPAQAGGISFGFGDYDDDFGFDSDYGWDDDDYGIVVEIDPEDYVMDGDEDDDDYHVTWCKNHFQTYDEDTDMYFYAPGKQKHCNSPG